MRHQDYLDVAASRDKATFEQRLLRFAQNMDFGIVSAALAVDQPGEKPLFVMIGNTPQGFVEASRSFAGVQRDPVLKRLKSTSTPFVYDQSLYVEEDAADLGKSKRPSVTTRASPWPCTCLRGATSCWAWTVNSPCPQKIRP